ncbi:MAG TPA: copper resistance protein CopC [Iamia sp.]|nr:copper resistance protein CopC [Iamia sp.]
MPASARRRLLAVGTVLAGLVLAVLVGAGPAGAHATLQDTSPADDALVDAVPGAVVLRFDEPVSASTGAVQVIAPDGDRVDGSVDDIDGGRGLSIDVDGGERGTYTVAYRVVSDDGHTITGSFVFHVGQRTGAATIDQSIPVATSAVGGIGRWLGYAGAAVAVGAALLLALLRRGPADGRPTGAALGRLGTLVVGGTAASALGTTAAVVAQTATTTGRSLVGALTLVPEVVADSRPVAVALLRAAILVGAALVGLAGRARRLPGALVGTGAVVAAAGLLAPVAGHPWTADPRTLAVPADALHLLAASVWLGLLAALVVAGPALADPDRAVRLVSGAALVAAAVVAVSGTASGWLLLGSVDALTDTASGQLVALKAVGFGVLVLLGWLNRSRLVPLLARAVPPAEPAPSAEPAEREPRAAAARRRLLQLVRAEVVVGALVLAVTAGLVNQPPGRDTLAQPYADVRTDGELQMRLEVDPARAGDNTIHVYLTDATGRPVRFDALEVTVAREGVPDRKLDGVTPISPDHASVYGASLPTPGTWTVDVTTVTLSTTAQFSFEVPVR